MSVLKECLHFLFSYPGPKLDVNAGILSNSDRYCLSPLTIRQAPEPEELVNLHFIAFVNHKDQLFQLGGCSHVFASRFILTVERARLRLRFPVLLHVSQTQRTHLVNSKSFFIRIDSCVASRCHLQSTLAEVTSSHLFAGHHQRSLEPVDMLMD